MYKVIIIHKDGLKQETNKVGRAAAQWIAARMRSEYPGAQVTIEKEQEENEHL